MIEIKFSIIVPLDHRSLTSHNDAVLRSIGKIGPGDESILIEGRPLIIPIGVPDPTPIYD